MLGRAGLGAEMLKGGGVKLLHPILFPPRSKKCQGSRGSWFCSPKSPFFALLFPFWHYCSLPTSKYTVPWFVGFPLMHFSAVNCLCLAKFVRQFMMNSCFDLLEWGVVVDGRRRMVYYEIIGHVTLSLFPTFSCLNVRPPSAW